MSDKEELQDPLKPLDKIYDADRRQKFFAATLEDRYKALNEIVLNENVPLEVRQLFETAKNLSLYSWFVYRFHQVAELISFSALEMALRQRYLSESLIEANSNRRAPALYKLMQHAKDKKWIANEGFQSLYKQAKRLAEHHKALEMAQTHNFEEELFMSIEKPTEEEVAAVIANSDMVKVITDNAHKIRNNLAHGSSTLHPNSISTLRTNAEVINQIYPS